MNKRLKQDWEQTRADLSPRRAREALRRDWEQTKHDLNLPVLNGKDLGVTASITLRQEPPAGRAPRPTLPVLLRQESWIVERDQVDSTSP